LLNPRKIEHLMVGDEVTILGPPGARKEFNAVLGKVRTPKDFVMVGGGILAEQFLDLMAGVDCSIKLIEEDEARCRWLSRKFGHVTVINDNGTDPTVLMNENVNMADALICTTDSEEENLLSCLIGKHLGVSKTITKYSRREYEKIFDMSGVDAAIGTYHVVANELVNQILPEQDMLVFKEGFDELLIGVPISEKCIYMGSPCVDLALPDHSVLGMVLRNERPLPPTPDLILSGGDYLLIYAHRHDVPQLERMFNTKVHLGP
jgi:trk system potassium uptake protein TrkA